MLKRLLDIVVSIAGLTVLSPLLIAVAVMIKLDDGGPVFYRGARVGRGGRLFNIYKFRTMVLNAEKVGGPSTSENDPRITRIGSGLRAYKLDELPQLINVLIGDMSLVGPRPEVKSEVDSYDPKWKPILSVRPGITDLSSIAFRDEGGVIKRSGIEDPHEAYKKLIQPRKLELQLEYVRRRSLLLDLSILWQTVLAVIRKG